MLPDMLDMGPSMLGLIESDVVLIGTSLEEVAWRLVQRLLSAGGELLTLVWGTGAGDDLLTRITARVRQRFPMVRSQRSARS